MVQFFMTETLCWHIDVVGSVEKVALALSLFSMCSSKSKEKKSATCMFHLQVKLLTPVT